MQKSVRQDRHYCMNAESLQLSNGKKLQTFVGNCCKLPKLKWKATGEITSQNGDVCLGTSDGDGVDVDVKFEDSKQTLLSVSIYQV